MVDCRLLDVSVLLVEDESLVEDDMDSCVVAVLELGNENATLILLLSSILCC